MAIDTITPRTRRALLAGTLGGAVALVAGALGRPLSGQAADGDAIHLGGDVSGTRSTRITTSGPFALDARSTSDAGVGVRGQATASSSATYGVVGASESPDGTGVGGFAFASAGTTYGVYGQIDSPAGSGVRGYASARSGEAYGVSGLTESVDGVGVQGEAVAGTGKTYGVAGLSDSKDGAGIFGGGTGRGGIFIGRSAQVTLVPATGSHPESGLMGDLFLDSDGALWLCKGTTDWKQLA